LSESGGMVAVGSVSVSALPVCSDAPHCMQNFGNRAPRSAPQDVHNMNDYLPLSQCLPDMPGFARKRKSIIIKAHYHTSLSGKAMRGFLYRGCS
jgi:hypothetical protein